ncbi:MAG: hypothetical protein M3Q47_18525 [Actinomycetota bacterium]|nr:hypothetical protein [Actinomycetota bacterium]
MPTGAAGRSATGGGRPYREWVALADGEPDTDLPLAREALAFARARRDTGS